jgi:hypothetical protein
MAEKHDWHLFDERIGLECRQVTEEGKPNIWEIRKRGEDKIVSLTDREFAQLREEGPNPKGL